MASEKHATISHDERNFKCFSARLPWFCFTVADALPSRPAMHDLSSWRGMKLYKFCSLTWVLAKNHRPALASKRSTKSSSWIISFFLACFWAPRNSNASNQATSQQGFLRILSLNGCNSSRLFLLISNFRVGLFLFVPNKITSTTQEWVIQSDLARILCLSIKRACWLYFKNYS